MADGEVDDLPINELKSLNCFGVFSNLDNAYIDDDDDELHTDTLAQAYFQRNVDIGGSLRLGIETSTTTSGVTTYTNTGGNILVKINNVSYTLTPTILSYLKNISSDIQTQVNNIINSYLTTATAASTYQTITGMTNYLTTATAASTYQTITGMTSYLTTATAASTYQTITGMTSYLSTATAASTYQTITGMPSYLTTATAASTYQTITGMTSYLTTATAQDITAAKTYFADINRVFSVGTSGGTLTGKVKIGDGMTQSGEKGMIIKYAFAGSGDTGGRGIIHGEYQGNYYTPICINPYGDIDDNRDNVGIGTYSPNILYKLDVNGSMNATTIYENGTLLSSKYATKINHIYCELGGNFEPIDVVATPSLAGLDVQSDYYTATYNSVNAIVGYNLINNTGPSGSVNYYTAGNFRNYVVSGYDKSVYGFNTLTGNWKCPQSGNYSICISFYITSNHSLNRFSLNKYNSANELLVSQYCLMEEITTDTLRPFTTILYMNKDEYFNIKLTSHSGNAVMRFEGMNYTSMKIMLLG